MPMSEIKLRLSHIEKSFPGVNVLKDINLAVKKGTVHVLCGENGAGKSTLMKIINGVHKADGGEIFIDEKPVTVKNPIAAREMGISMIFQELNYIPEMTVEECLFVGRWPLTAIKSVDWKKIRRDTEALLAAENLKYAPTAKMKDLSVSDVQMMEILKAISYKSSVIIMDEPTSAITQREVDALFEKIARLKASGVSVIYISHKMDEIFRIADEITVLRDGMVISTKARDETTIDEVITMMVGRELSGEFPKETIAAGENELEVERLCRGGYFEDISFHARRNEIVGFAGLMGAGRTEVMRAIFGLDPYTAGKIRKRGERIKNLSVKESIENGVVMLSEDRRRYGIVPVRSVRENTTLAALGAFFHGGRLHVKDENEKVSDICHKINVKTPHYEISIDALSGGNQQKVVLAKWLLRNADVLIMDEPTRGIDVGAKYEIYKLMTAFVKEGKTILMVSSELPELIGMCDRIYVMAKGRIQGMLERAEFSQEAIMQLATGTKTQKQGARNES
jgi:inositol transport system ATP-binding protein